MIPKRKSELRFPLLLIYIFVITVFVIRSAAAHASPRVEQIINSDWRFKKADVPNANKIDFNDSQWQQLNLPHTWNAQDVFNNDGYYRGPGLYRKVLAIPKSAKGKRVFLRFEAASIVTDVYFNGTHLGQHRGAFGAFCYELTPHIQPDGKNVLAVEINNAQLKDVPPLGGDFNMFGGIYRPVSLIITDPVCITPLDYASPGVYLTQTKVNEKQANVDVLAKISNGSDSSASVVVRTTILDHNSKTVTEVQKKAKIKAKQTKDVQQQIKIKNPHLWNGRQDPYIYQAKVQVLKDGKVLDEVTQPLGLRFFHVDTKQGFFLNGRPFKLKGLNRHQDRPGKGWAISQADQDYDLEFFLDIGANCVRLAHYPHSDYFYGICDKTGLIVWAELPLVNQVFDTPAFTKNAKQQLTELIRQNYNHPSIVFWSLYNELGNFGPCDYPVPLLTRLQALAKKEDTVRYTVAASNDAGNKFSGMRTVADLVAWNTYPGWYVATPSHIGGYIDRYNRMDNFKGLCISEYGAGASVKHHQQNMKRGPKTDGPWHPEQWQAIVHENSYPAIEQRNFVWGSFIWLMFDFPSHWRNEGDTKHTNDKGLVTYDRKVKKDAYFYYKAKWSDKPVLYITSRRHIERTQPLTEIKVYSNCDAVEVKVNGQSFDKKTTDNCIARWTDVKLKEGTNTIETTGVRNGETLTDQCQWKYTKSAADEQDKED
jgi:beta-galactosidase